MRIAIGGIEHETNTYATESMGTTRLDDFQQLRGDEIFNVRGTRSFVGGFLSAIDATDDDAIPLLWAWAGPSGIIEASTYGALKTEYLERLTAVLPVDAVAVSMHGAGVVEGIEDLEADFAAAIRAVVGPDMPIVVPLDLHGNITVEMGERLDLMLGVQEYPHTDMFDRGVEAIEQLPALVAGTRRPTTHVERLPLLLPTSTTDEGPAADIRDLCLAAERRPGVIDASFFHGFPYTDIGATGASIVVITDNDPALAHEVATEIAREVWSRRNDFMTESLQPVVTIELANQALATLGGPVVINDTADNPGGGTPGDGTHLLAAMIEANVAGSCFGFVFDPITAEAAHEAGVGATIDVRIGGRHGPLHGDPVEATAYVKTLTDGRVVYTSQMVAGVRANLGRSARLTIGNIDVIVTSRRSQTFDAEIFTLHGIDVTTRSIVGLKSSQHFRAGFRDIATKIITADSPGLTTLDVTVFDHPAADGALWPIDPDLTWQPSQSQDKPGAPE